MAVAAVLGLVVLSARVAWSGWVDPQTPLWARATTAIETGFAHTLVFSDEFEVEGRSFADGDDPRWTAVDKNDYTNMALHYYHADHVRTTNGVLNITTDYAPTTFESAEDEEGFVQFKTRRKPFSSGLVQGWNKFCFTGGIVEIVARLPGKATVGGLWPAMWLLGAMARATYVASTDWMWPWSYNTCDRERQYTQEINACEPSPHYGLRPNTGRGAPEIDILEAMPGVGTLNYGLEKPYWSTSYQVAPGKLHDRPVEGKRPNPGQWYEDGLRYGGNTSINAFFYGEELKHFTKRETYVADALSANTHIDDTHFTNFHTYRLEWEVEPDREALRWYLDGDFIYEILPRSLDFTGAKMPDEPMHILLNTAVSSTWGFPLPWEQPPGCDSSKKCYDCGSQKCACQLPVGFCEMLPAHYEIDSVRVYQRLDEKSHKIGCSTDTHPTRRFIEGHVDRYFDPYNGENKPLHPVKAGGARCRSSATCGDGTCVSGRCRCSPTATGPECKAFVAFNDISYEEPWRLRLSTPFVPPMLRTAVLAFLVLTAGIVAFRISAQRKARSASLIASSPALPTPSNNPPPKVEPKKPASPKKRKAAEPPAIKRKKTTGVNHESVVYETNKGKLVQALLRRWWYAIDWPSKEARSKVPEENFEVLSGFPGVHVCTSGPRLGELVDHRDHDAAPSFVNLYAKPAKELKELVATAFESQINQLKNHEPDSPMIPGLQKEMKGAAKINADKADVEARKAFAEYQKNTQGRR
ncbi:hypothetical protein CTAYLR_008653 [Chrysophaeum taylorii]|uniref:GH16 domain-containing protein n=1 Tax=Chrysophaeum taylorii TaxID=2483200 RepID=A0AAD7XHQ1_9STRA|nr:hypothetical protein CTAYLR_008653 [Chrysophaeum taylorii]